MNWRVLVEGCSPSFVGEVARSLVKARIPFRLNGTSFDDPVLEVPISTYRAAWVLLVKCRADLN